jgi:hypothetical protein
MVNNNIPPEAAPFLGIPVAELLHGSDISGPLRNETVEVLLNMKQHFLVNEPLLQIYQNRLGLPLDGPSVSITETVPAIERELRRRSRPEFVGRGPIAEIKASVDVLEVAQRYTKMIRCGAGKWKGICPLHDEQSPSFYVYEADQHFHCYGCHAHGDVINLMILMGSGNV